MKRTACFVLGGILTSSLLSSMSYYVLELRGGSHIFAVDAPIRKGRLTLFHRYPDGVYMSLSSSEVVSVATSQEAPQAAPGKAEKLSPGDTLYIGSALQGPGHVAQEPLSPPDANVYSESGYGGYLGYGWGGYVPPAHPIPRPPTSSNIGPNGFPILAPPGSPGSVPPAIGPNGFPILAPQPPGIAPRRS